MIQNNSVNSPAFNGVIRQAVPQKEVKETTQDQDKSLLYSLVRSVVNPVSDVSISKDGVKIDNGLLMKYNPEIDELVLSYDYTKPGFYSEAQESLVDLTRSKDLAIKGTMTIPLEESSAKPAFAKLQETVKNTLTVALDYFTQVKPEE